MNADDAPTPACGGCGLDDVDGLALHDGELLCTTCRCSPSCEGVTL